MPSISIIIPIDNQESEWCQLLQYFNTTPRDICEIILVGDNISHITNIKNISNRLTKKLKIISSNIPGRANNMNYGASQAKGSFLWFLHADSNLAPNTIKQLISSIKLKPNNLHYCDLSFYDSFFLIKLNMIGAWIRSRIFKIPFGDQGICINKKNLIH